MHIKYGFLTHPCPNFSESSNQQFHRSTDEIIFALSVGFIHIPVILISCHALGQDLANLAPTDRGLAKIKTKLWIPYYHSSKYHLVKFTSYSLSSFSAILAWCRRAPSHCLNQWQPRSPSYVRITSPPCVKDSPRWSGDPLRVTSHESHGVTNHPQLYFFQKFGWHQRIHQSPTLLVLFMGTTDIWVTQ